MSADVSQPGLDALLDYLRRTRGFDFGAYKRASLSRRIQKRMHTVGAEKYEDYLDYLQVHPDEFPMLFDTILINVTDFFRDAPLWEYVSAEILPRIIGGKKADEPIRVWVAGCSSGEEACTVAMILAERLGTDAFRDRVKIYATDVDEGALATARQASYTAAQIQNVPPELLERYFERTDSRFTLRKDLRRALIFGRHDLVQDAPISRIDLLVCRNTLMYFNAEAQSRILAHFHFAVNPGGYLFLGKGEMLLTRANLFTPVDLSRRVYGKAARVESPRPLPFAGDSDPVESDGVAPLVNRVWLRDAAFDAGPVAQVALDSNGTLVLANAPARELFGLTRGDLGRPLHDLAFSYRPLELRPYIDEARAQHRLVLVKSVEWHGPAADPRWFDVQVLPLGDAAGRPLGVGISLVEVTRQYQLATELDRTRQELETAHEELQSTIEELETTNEELQSTNEELETTNEELQSTNEELETMNEELQSTNEELETMNGELRQRGGELNQVNAFLQSILTSLRMGVVVVDGDLLIEVWNSRAEDLWGLREEEVVGKNFLNLEIGLPVADLRQPIRACLAGESEFQLLTTPAVNRRGRSIRCRTAITPLAGAEHDVQGAILLMEEEDATGATERAK